MGESVLWEEISDRDADTDRIADRVIGDPRLLDDVFAGLDADTARTKYGCEKVLRKISEKSPIVLYPHFAFFAGLLDHENNFLKWGAIHTIANLAAVDSENEFEKIFEKYFAPIPGPQLIPAANAISGAGKIARAKPELVDKIADELLKVESAKYQTAECRNIALGKAITSFNQFYEQITDKEAVLRLVKGQLDNTRNATRKKAEGFLKKWSDAGFC